MDIPEDIFRDTKLRERDEIRLVEILYSTSVPKVRLCVVDLRKKPSYVALSYSWGAPNEFSHADTRCDISINGRHARIMVNLNRFLQHSSESNLNQLFWIDALCINQKDTDEVQYLIQLMPRIYKEASLTLCWLPIFLDTPELKFLQRSGVISSAIDEEDQRPPRGLITRTFQRLYKKHTQPLQAPQYLVIGRVSDPDPYRSDHKIRPEDLEAQEQNLMREDEEVWRGLYTILEDSYFSRLWVFPDWILADKITIRCYSGELNWDTLCSILEMCLFYCPSALLSSIGLLNLVSADYLKRQKKHASASHMSLEDVIIARQNGNFRVTNHNDYVAALRGICHEFSIDLVTDAIEASRSRGLNSLCHAYRSQGSARLNPSWATDWAWTRNLFLLNHRKSSYRASPVDGEYHGFEDTLVMICGGLEVDYVKEVSQYLPSRRHCDHYNMESYNTTTFSQWFELAKKQRHRSGRGTDVDEETLRDFADTIQARGCNSIWETPELVKNAVHSLRDLLAFLEDENTAITSQLRVFYAACYPSHGRRFAVTGRGNFCLVPKDVTQDDRICIPCGSRVPFVFRKFGSDYINLGEAYVHGYMNGEASVGVAGTKEQTFRIV